MTSSREISPHESWCLEVLAIHGQGWGPKDLRFFERLQKQTKSLGLWAKSVFKNIIAIYGQKSKLPYPKLGNDTLGVIRHYMKDKRRFKRIVDKYCPDYWKYDRQEKMKEKRRIAAEKAGRAAEEKKIREERKKNPLLAEALDKIKNLEEALSRSSEGSGCCHNSGHDWPDDGRIGGYSSRR